MLSYGERILCGLAVLANAACGFAAIIVVGLFSSGEFSCAPGSGTHPPLIIFLLVSGIGYLAVTPLLFVILVGELWSLGRPNGFITVPLITIALFLVGWSIWGTVVISAADSTAQCARTITSLAVACMSLIWVEGLTWCAVIIVSLSFPCHPTSPRVAPV